MADQGDASTDLLFVCGKPPSKFRMNAKRRQEIPGDDLGIQLNRSLQSCQRKQIVVIADQVIERTILRAPVKKIRIGNIDELWIVRVHRLSLDQAIWLVVGQWSQHHRIDYAENSGVRADSQRQRDHRGGGEAGI